MMIRPANWVDGRTVQTFHQPADAILVDAVRAEITALPIAVQALWSIEHAH